MRKGNFKRVAFFYAMGCTMVNLVVQWSTWWYNGYLVLTIIFQIVEEEILYHQLIKIQKTTTSLL